jgi:hypothetical protein
MDILFDQTVQIDPALSPKPDWYRNAFACTGEQFSQDNFFEPADVIRDLENILAEIMHRNPQLPVHYWPRTGNKAGITGAVPMGSVDIYYEKKTLASLLLTGTAFTSGVPKEKYVTSQV